MYVTVVRIGTQRLYLEKPSLGEILLGGSNLQRVRVTGLLGSWSVRDVDVLPWNERASTRVSPHVRIPRGVLAGSCEAL